MEQTKKRGYVILGMSSDSFERSKYAEFIATINGTINITSDEFKRLACSANITRDHVIEFGKVAAIFGRPKRPSIPPNVHKLTYQRKRQ